MSTRVLTQNDSQRRNVRIIVGPKNATVFGVPTSQVDELATLTRHRFEASGSTGVREWTERQPLWWRDRSRRVCVLPGLSLRLAEELTRRGYRVRVHDEARVAVPDDACEWLEHERHAAYAQCADQVTGSMRCVIAAPHADDQVRVIRTIAMTYCDGPILVVARSGQEQRYLRWRLRRWSRLRSRVFHGGSRVNFWLCGNRIVLETMGVFGMANGHDWNVVVFVGAETLLSPDGFDHAVALIRTFIYGPTPQMYCLYDGRPLSHDERLRVEAICGPVPPANDEITYPLNVIDLADSLRTEQRNVGGIYEQQSIDSPRPIDRAIDTAEKCRYSSGKRMGSRRRQSTHPGELQAEEGIVPSAVGEVEVESSRPPKTEEMDNEVPPTSTDPKGGSAREYAQTPESDDLKNSINDSGKQTRDEGSSIPHTDTAENATARKNPDDKSVRAETQTPQLGSAAETRQPGQARLSGVGTASNQHIGKYGLGHGQRTTSGGGSACRVIRWRFAGGAGCPKGHSAAFFSRRPYLYSSDLATENVRTAGRHTGHHWEFVRRARAVITGNAKADVAAHLWKWITDERNLRAAWDWLAVHGGTSPGPNRRQYSDLDEHELWELLRAYRHALRTGKYRTSRALTRKFPKRSGGFRRLQLMNVEDRIVHRAIAQILQPFLDTSFSPHSFGFRSHVDRRHALATAIRIAEAQPRHLIWIAADIKDFFDFIPHERLYQILQTRVPADVLALVRGAADWHRRHGLRQGSPLSPLLSNVYLDHLLDRPWITAHTASPLLRVVDDLLIPCCHRKTAHDLYADLVRRVTSAGLRLKGTADTSIFDLAAGRSVDWLGYRVYWRDDRILVGIADGAWQRLEMSLRRALGTLTPATTAFQAVLGWIEQQGPAYDSENRDLVCARVGTLARQFGLKEVPSDTLIADHWRQSWERWIDIIHTGDNPCTQPTAIVT